MKTMLILVISGGLEIALISGCKDRQNSTHDDSVITDTIAYILKNCKIRNELVPGFTFDSLKAEPPVLNCYVTDSMGFWNYLPVVQKAEFCLQDFVKVNYKMPDSVTVIVQLPNREGQHQFAVSISGESFYQRLLWFNDECYGNALGMLWKFDQSDTSMEIVDLMNSGLAWYIYHENTIKYAFEGFNSYDVLHGYSVETSQHIYGQYHSLMDSVKQSWSTRKDYGTRLNEILSYMENCTMQKTAANEKR